MRNDNDLGAISVVMPAFNAEATILRAIRSVQNQTFANWTLTIVDDGSTDATSETVRTYLSANPDVRVRLDTLPANVGVAEARNIGIASSSGEWLVFCDADDEMYESHRANLMSALSDDVDMVVCGRTVVLPDGSEQDKHSLAVGNFSGAEATRLSMSDRLSPFPWDRLVRRSLFSNLGYPKGAIRFEDMMTNIVLCSKSRRVVSIAERGIRYFVTGGSITWGNVYSLADTQVAWDYMMSHLPESLTTGRYRASLGCARTIVALLIGQTALVRDAPSAPEERRLLVKQTVAECRAHIRAVDIFHSFGANPTIASAALLFKTVPCLYARLYRRYVASSYAVEG